MLLSCFLICDDYITYSIHEPHDIPMNQNLAYLHRFILHTIDQVYASTILSIDSMDCCRQSVTVQQKVAQVGPTVTFIYCLLR